VSAGPNRTQLAAVVAQAAEATARALAPRIIVSDQGHGVDTAAVIRIPSPFLTPVDGADRDEILRRVAIVATVSSLRTVICRIGATRRPGSGRHRLRHRLGVHPGLRVPAVTEP
jgi:hypothetical protein